MFSFQRLQLRSRLAVHPFSSIREVKEGQLVKLRGRTLPSSKNKLLAPITGRSCVHYQINLGEWFNGTKTPFASVTNNIPLQLKMKEGDILVHTDTLNSKIHKNSQKGHSSQFPLKHKALVNGLGLSMVDDLGELRSLDFQENIVQQNANVIILGTVRSISDIAGIAHYRAMPKTLILQATDMLEIS